MDLLEHPDAQVLLEDAHVSTAALLDGFCDGYAVGFITEPEERQEDEQLKAADELAFANHLIHNSDKIVTLQ